MERLANKFTIGPDRVHISVVGFGNRATTFFDLDDYQTFLQVFNAMQTRVKYKVRHIIYRVKYYINI